MFMKMYSKLPIIRHIWGMRCISYMNLWNGWERALTETKYKVKTCFCFSSCIEVFLCDVADWWAKDFICIYYNAITYLSNLYCMTCIATSWQVNECAPQIYVLNNFIKMVNFHWNFWLVDKNFRCLDTRELRIYCTLFYSYFDVLHIQNFYL
jgi:hypothetical protein